MGWW